MTVVELIEGSESKIRNRMTTLSGKSMTAFDPVHHYKKARDFYTAAIQLHTAGQAYQDQIKEMIYLEDDFNDNGYHFGAAYERYLMINDFFTAKLTEIGGVLPTLIKQRKKLTELIDCSYGEESNSSAGMVV